MCDEYGALESALRSVTSSLEVAELSGPEARLLTGYFSGLTRLCHAAEVRCAARVAECRAHLGSGESSAAAFFGRVAGRSVAEAARELEAAASLSALPEVEAAFRSGELSGPQLAEVAAAAAVSPGSAAELVEVAKQSDLFGLRRHCAAKAAEARFSEDEAKRSERLHRGRHLRHFVDDDGALRLSARLAPDAGARLLAALERATEARFRAARRAGEHEANEAYRADALVDLVTAGAPAGTGPQALVKLRVDLAALRRGALAPGECCEIPGIGPVPLGVARELMGDAVLEAFIASGSDVQGLCHLGRTLPARLKAAVEARDPCCVVPGCGKTYLLEIDHCKIPFAEGGPATLDNLARLCRHHHRLKTHRGYQLLGGPGHWIWRAPGDPEDTPGETGDPGDPPPGPPDEKAPPGRPDRARAADRARAPAARPTPRGGPRHLGDPTAA